jgi:hypothetical protein
MGSLRLYSPRLAKIYAPESPIATVMEDHAHLRSTNPILLRVGVPDASGEVALPDTFEIELRDLGESESFYLEVTLKTRLWQLKPTDSLSNSPEVTFFTNDFEPRPLRERLTIASIVHHLPLQVHRTPIAHRFAMRGARPIGWYPRQGLTDEFRPVDRRRTLGTQDRPILGARAFRIPTGQVFAVDLDVAPDAATMLQKLQQLHPFGADQLMKIAPMTDPTRRLHHKHRFRSDEIRPFYWLLPQAGPGGFPPVPLVADHSQMVSFFFANGKRVQVDAKLPCDGMSLKKQLAQTWPDLEWYELHLLSEGRLLADNEEVEVPQWSEILVYQPTGRSMTLHPAWVQQLKADVSRLASTEDWFEVLSAEPMRPAGVSPMNFIFFWLAEGMDFDRVEELTSFMAARLGYGVSFPNLARFTQRPVVRPLAPPPATGGISLMPVTRHITGLEGPR